MPDTTQLVVIGAGPGGYATAFHAADLGLKVALVDPEANPGGVCLYRGCIPSKALLHVARVLSESKEAANWGLEFAAPKIDINKMRAWKQGVVNRLTGGLGMLTKQHHINYIRGKASFVDASTLSITMADGGEPVQLGFETAVLATGSRPIAIPSLALDSPRVMDSTGGLDLQDLPKTLLVVGGGYIGLELGTVYAALGSQVSVVEMMPGLLPGVDRDLVNILQKRLEKKFRAIMLSTKVAKMTEEAGGIRVQFESEGTSKGDDVYEKVLVSVGRRPNSEVPGLDKTKVEIDAKGFIKVDAQRRTAEPNIFAIGDVAGEPMLAHKASHEGRVAVEVIAGKNVIYEPRAIPAVVFTDPEIAWCGVTEEQAKKDNIKITVARFPWGASGRATTFDRNDGQTKLIIDPVTQRVLGMAVVGVGAGELIAEGVLAVEMAALASDVELTIHPHPTLSETVMEAAEVFFGQSTHVYRPTAKKAPG
jgi:dihydrolipoamide dehydrogenase